MDRGVFFLSRPKPQLKDSSLTAAAKSRHGMTLSCRAMYYVSPKSISSPSGAFHIEDL